MNVQAIKQIGNLQNANMFRAFVLAIPILDTQLPAISITNSISNAAGQLGSTISAVSAGNVLGATGILSSLDDFRIDPWNFSFLIREANIPEYTRDYTNLRFMDSQVAIPQGRSHSGEWNVPVLFDERGKVYNTLVRWWSIVNKRPTAVTDRKTSVFIEFYNLRKILIKVVELIGVEPKNIPEITGLNQEGEGFISADCTFAFDDINFEVNPIIYSTLVGAYSADEVVEISQMALQEGNKILNNIQNIRTG